MVRLSEQYGLGHIFSPGFPGLIEAFYVQEKLVEFLMPAVHKAFVSYPRSRVESILISEN